MLKPVIIINEQHQLMDSQTELLLSVFGVDGWNTLYVPKEGWNKSQMDEVMSGPDLRTSVIVFVSPIGYMIKKLSIDSATVWSRDNDHSGLLPSPINHTVERVYVMSNDNREKKELPNGKIIMVVAKEGWYLG